MIPFASGPFTITQKTSQAAGARWRSVEVGIRPGLIGDVNPVKGGFPVEGSNPASLFLYIVGFYEDDLGVP